MIVKLQGGLGNQMFIAAYGLTEAKKRGETLQFDDSGLVGNRSYALDPFNLNIKFAVDLAMSGYRDVEVGYWQGEKYFNADLIRPLFSHPGKLIKNAVAVHIRLTDNLSERALALHGNLLETDYYEKAFRFIKKKVRKPDLLIFTDDPDECSKYFASENIVRGNAAHEDLWLMSKCEYHIIANSSFSWWAAFLGCQKLVIAPHRWFVNPEWAHPTAKMEDIIPDRWVKL